MVSTMCNAALQATSIPPFAQMAQGLVNKATLVKVSVRKGGVEKNRVGKLDHVRCWLLGFGGNVINTYQEIVKKEICREPGLIDRAIIALRCFFLPHAHRCKKKSKPHSS